MLRVAMLERDLPLRERLYDLVKKFAAERGEPCRFAFFANEIDFLKRYDHAYDVIVIDTELSFSDGIRAAEKIRALDDRVGIVFVSCDAARAAVGYAAGAADFLVRPVHYDGVARTMQRAYGRSRQKPARADGAPPERGSANGRYFRQNV